MADAEVIHAAAESVRFGVTDAVKAEGVCLPNDYGTNMSFRKLIKVGFQVLTF